MNNCYSIISSFILFISIFLIPSHSQEGECNLFLECTSEVFCRGDILQTVCGESGLFDECKSYVDMPINGTEEEVIEAFNNLPEDCSPEQLQSDFIDKYFLPVGSEVIPIQPIDWKENPSIVDDLQSYPSLSSWAYGLNYLWPNLSRIFKQDPRYTYTSINVQHPFVVPGGRFREFYYWDAFWIIEGLLLCEMTETAQGMIRNFFDITSAYGYVPNGARIYYLNRSQPPLLTQMVSIYFSFTKNISFVQEALPFLEKEYQFWSQECNYVSLSSISTDDKLSRYYTLNQIPRPEMYETDLETTSSMTDPNEIASTYQNIAAGAATGWDFSSRWFKDGVTLSTIQTTKIVPVDLNMIMFKNEKTISDLYQLLISYSIGDLSYNQGRMSYFQEQALWRKSLIDKYLWSPEKGQWFDFNVETKSSNENYFVSNYLGLWAGIISDDEIPNQITCSDLKSTKSKQRTDSVYTPESLCLLKENLQTLISSELSGPATSHSETGQQWDSPNAWAPMMDFLIIGMEELETHLSELKQSKEQLISKWLRTNYCGWKEKGQMFEKYNVSAIGQPGGGGEYTVQSGFGWTNGVVLRLLRNYFASSSSGPSYAFSPFSDFYTSISYERSLSDVWSCENNNRSQ